MATKTHVLLKELYESLGRKILSTLLKRNGGDLAAAESVLQDTFIAAYTSFHTFRHKSSYFTWLTRIALNKLADYYRDQIHHQSRMIYPTLKQLSTYEDPNLSPLEELSLTELRNQVNSSLNLLPPEYRQLLQLKYYQQLSNTDICLRLKTSPRSLEGKLYRAKKALAKIYNPH